MLKSLDIHIKSITVPLDRFLEIVPDFIIELRSTTDRLNTLQAKMQEYLRLGVKLGLLVNPQDKQVEIYREGQTEIETLEVHPSISCEDMLSGFVLNLQKIWQ
jgi:Uma2 family endonuclease